MSYYNKLKINGTDYPIATAIYAAEAPTAATEGVPGQTYYYDTGSVIRSYVCSSAVGGVYTWREISGGVIFTIDPVTGILTITKED